MAGDSLLWDAARAIYAAPLSDFIGVRNEQVRELKSNGDIETAQQVAAFKKPSAAADLVNRLVRHEPELTDEIDELGARLRAAQVDADAAALRALDKERRDLVGRCVAAARDHARAAGKVATDATLRDVEQTMWAAIIDARAGATVRAGLLVQPLSAGGFSGMEVAGASALDVEVPADEPRRPARRRRAASPSADRPQKPSAAEVRATQKAAQELEQAQATAQQMQRQLELAAQEAESAQARLDELQDERARLRAELSEVEDNLKAARHDVSDRRGDLKSAERQRRAASAQVDRALSAVDRG